jgi:hypothetical protein
MPTRARVAKAHEELFRLIAPALAELGVRDLPSCLELLGGVITAAGRALRRDRARRGLVEGASTFAVAGAKALVGRR